jgi:putative transposase
MGKLVYRLTTVYNVNYPMVESVKHRRRVFTGKGDMQLKELLQWIAQEKGFSIGSRKIITDHVDVNVAVATHSKFSPSYKDKMFKGLSVRKLLREGYSLTPTSGKDRRAALRSVVLNYQDARGL